MARSGDGRPGPLRRLALAALLGAACAGPALAASDYLGDPSITPARDISGVWQRESYSPELRPADGSPLALTAEGRRVLAENAKDLKGTDRGLGRCVPLGTPRNLVSPYPLLVVQSPGKVNMLFERNRAMVSRVYNAQFKDPAIWDPSFAGDGVAKWEGDDLVIDVRNINGENWIDDSGVPTSDKLHVVERWKKRPDGKLQVDVTIEDPTIFTRAWTAQVVYAPKPDVRIQDDWVCDEPHRPVADVPGAARYFPNPSSATARR